MKATPANMKMLCANKGAPIAVPGVFSYCTGCGRRESASPGDYFAHPDDEPITCRHPSHKPRAMVLARAVTTVTEVNS